jgi:hypothetical protein
MVDLYSFISMYRHDLKKTQEHELLTLRFLLCSYAFRLPCTMSAFSSQASFGLFQLSMFLFLRFIPESLHGRTVSNELGINQCKKFSMGHSWSIW